MNRQLAALYLLAAARNFGPAEYDIVVAALGAPEVVLDAPEDKLKRLTLPGSMAGRLLEARQGCDVAKELARLEHEGVKLVGWGSAEYPELLAQVADAPLLLFCKGDPSLMRHHGIAVVGSRKCTDTGREFAEGFGRELSELGIPVVSGMALGIDAAAHEGALTAQGPTVAVLGCGVDVVYPPQHHSLYGRLCETALVVSEYPLGTEPRREHFPQRNRIISGLSKGVLVVEAPRGSGALITAKLAVEQGRDVFALPGPLRSPYSKGCHYLIKAGQAKLVEDTDDILAEYGTSRARLVAERSGLFAPAAGASTLAAVPPAAALSADEQRVLTALSYEGTHVNQLVRELGWTTSECIAHLTMLEIKGLISTSSGGYYLRL